MIIKAISNYLTKHGIKHTNYHTSITVIGHTKSWKHNTKHIQHENNTIKITHYDWSKKPPQQNTTTIYTTDPHLLSKITNWINNNPITDAAQTQSKPLTIIQ